METVAIIAFITAIPFRLDIGFRNFNKEVGLELSRTKMGTGYQDAITPPKLNYVTYVFWPLNLFIIFGSFADFGAMGFIILGIFILSNVLTGIYILPKLNNFFLRILLNSMTNRHANYVRDGDDIRAKAIEGILNKFKKKYGKKILKSLS
tara:strand:- start:177 stop:626 length:450 start_codon:yes stop_codon:yes gene_type:complete